MSPDGTVEIDHVWKRFRADRGRRLFRDHVSRAQQRLTGNSAAADWRWVLRDVDFKITQGEAVGIMGINGAGKSTLLKMISGVMYPHSGRIRVAGRIGALLEVSSGIHPELTGRENINIFGTLLGLSRAQVNSKYDEIVAFAEIESAVNRQIKFYSSGMKTRLGFSIAAFLEPDVLVVDEVLAVGDQIFQQKCLDRMRVVLQSGVTLLLVSHDLASMGATATRGLWLHDGTLRGDGPIEQVLTSYRRDIEGRAAESSTAHGDVGVSDFQVSRPDGMAIETNEPCRLEFKLDSAKDRILEIFVGVTQGPATPIFLLSKAYEVQEGSTPFRVDIPRLPLPVGDFHVWVAVSDRLSRQPLTPWQPIAPLLVGGHRSLDPGIRGVVRLSPVFVEAQWETL